MKCLTFLGFLFSMASFAQTGYPEPVRVYEAEGMKVDAYDFASFEKFLHLDGDKTYVVNFWATWCVPCVKELPYFEQLGHAYRDRNVEVILVSLDMARQIESRLIPFISKKGLKSKVVFLQNTDSGEWVDKVDKSWSGALPATVIYNASGRKFYESSFTYETLEAELRTFIP